ncbi:MAG: hypothetical protein KBD07_01540 [Candidatus Omnitrophica bacterium]|jgi:hypothetical protein|nr:hypothetical protein [Candidatus Omnitrophota bacterium]
MTPDAGLGAMLSGILFGGIGSAALLFGHRQQRPRTMVIGGLMVAASYFLKTTLLIWLSGSVLVFALWQFRD